MKTKLTCAAIVTLLFMATAATAWSQGTSGKVQGKITDGGKPVPNADVVLTNVDNGKVYKLKADSNGQFSGMGIQFGIYNEDVTAGDKKYKGKVQVTGQNNGVDDLSVEMTSGSGTGPTKEQIAEREKGLNLNSLITKYNAAQTAKNWQEAADTLKQMIVVAPNRWEFQQALGNMQSNLGQYQDAVNTYEKVIPMAQNATKTDPKADPAKAKAAVAQMLTSEGNAYLKLKQNDKAIDAFTKAASMDPNPANAYFNICATQYNAGNTEGALVACDKVIAADPTKADAYFIKGSLMVGESKLDKEGKLQPPPGTSEALNKYLELAPDGPHAGDVKAMLQAMGAKVETTYKEKKKK